MAHIGEECIIGLYHKWQWHMDWKSWGKIWYDYNKQTGGGKGEDGNSGNGDMM